MAPFCRTSLAFLAAVTAGCTGSSGDGHRPVATGACAVDDDCPGATPYCCDVTDDGIGPDCFQHAFNDGGQAVCMDDECVNDLDCPGRKPHCCGVALTDGDVVLACFGTQTAGGYCY